MEILYTLLILLLLAPNWFLLTKLFDKIGKVNNALKITKELL